VNEGEHTPPQTSDQSRARFASRIRVYSPHTALQRVAADYMRQWIRWQPGVLFRYGCLGLQAEDREIYLGGLTARQNLFILVPESLYEQRRRAELLQIASELLQTQDHTILSAYCDLAEQECAETLTMVDHPAWNAEARARQVSSWVALLKYRKEVQTPDWRWRRTHL
jgi:hypothetical protein